MSIRLVCPTCATQLTVKDEFAGRAVKCPKCAAVIPAASPATPAAAAPPPPPPLPAHTAPAASEVTTTAPPASPARPRAMPVKADSGGPKTVGAPRSSRDSDDDRPVRARRPRDDDRDDDRPAKKGSSVGIVLAIVGFCMLTCCGSIGYGVYWFFNKAKETVNEIAEQLKPKNDKLTRANYDQIDEGMKRAEVEALLGKGRPAIPADLAAVFRGEATDPVRLADWTPKAQRGRLVLWQNRDDYLIVAFYPNANDDGRVQMKAFAPAAEAATQSGMPDDDAFARKYQLPRPDGTPGGAPIAVTAERLIQDYLDDPKSADAKFRDKLVEVTDGVLERWEGDAALVYPTGKKADPYRIRVTFLPAMRPKFARYKPGDVIPFRGKCESRAGTHIVVTRGEFAP